MLAKPNLILTILSLAFIAISPQQLSATEQNPPSPAQTAKEGEYDVVVLSEKMGKNIRERVKYLMEQQYGNRVLHWTVKEKNEIQYVYAYPSTSNKETKSFRDSINVEIGNPKAKSSYTYGCVRLYKYAYWQGSQFMICSNAGVSKSYSRLADYGFDNVASSYYEDRSWYSVEIYDGNNFTYKIGTIVNDWAWFDGRYDNKASSVRAWF